MKTSFSLFKQHKPALNRGVGSTHYQTLLGNVATKALPIIRLSHDLANQAKALFLYQISNQTTEIIMHKMQAVKANAVVRKEIIQ